ncbi:hypothetical protein AB0M32_42465 [Streptomyces sp. NPDC051985]|uniref:hypothetical protein n=1 Tax=Streptomyces sp. NPDC051985 TaxID=3155807 RepID=UPI00344ACC28
MVAESEVRPTPFAPGTSDTVAHEPMRIAAFGSTMVGGRMKSAVVRFPGQTVTATIWADQMYVQYMLPAERKHPCPIVLVHGGGCTGKAFEERPDGAEGWVNFFVRRGFDTYWVDKPWRGRSGFDPTAINQAVAEGDPGLIPEIHSPAPLELLTSEQGAFTYGRLPRDVMIEGLKQIVPDFTPALHGARDVTHGGPVIENALIALLEKTGPAVLLGHSQGGGEVFGLLRSRPDLVAGLIAVEPAAPPTADFEKYARAPLLNVWAEHRPAIEGAHMSNASEAAVLTDKVNAAGGDAALIVLSDLGITGNGHMMMQNTNSDDVARLLAEWIESHVRPVRPGLPRQ